jgi:hypothetical protein
MEIVENYKLFIIRENSIFIFHFNGFKLSYLELFLWHLLRSKRKLYY